MIRTFNELTQIARNTAAPKKVAVVAAHEEHVLEAVDLAHSAGILDPILIGDKGAIAAIIQAHGYQLTAAETIAAPGDVGAAQMAVSMVREGAADFIMKGKLQTADLLREVVNKERGLSQGRVMSHFGIFELPAYHKLLAVTDGGMVPHPTCDEKLDILTNAVDVLHVLGYEMPKVAVLTATETTSPKMPESIDAAKLKQLNETGEISGCIVEGPISFDLMFSEAAARVKGYASPVTGDADLLVVPNMTCGNLLAKAFQFTAGAKMAGMITGARVPIALVSRGAAAEEKYLSLLLCAVAATTRDN
ncbi:MAG: bifunctional enoyl-CoA hydratase/phosphate acetyltransferase [Propionibacteriaceae bacterium]|nr:bifunctional enoyl-CoA hydratase/phosphate acetyltransferase [Propionibacteriaceae bacterium]